MWQILYLSHNPVHPRGQIYPNIQSAAPKPLHGATGPCCTRCHYQEELQSSSCWQFLFKNLKRLPGEPLDSPFWLLLGSCTCHGLHSTLGSPSLEPSPVLHCSPWAGDPNSGHTIHDNMALMLNQNTLPPSFLTLAMLLFFTAFSHQH